MSIVRFRRSVVRSVFLDPREGFRRVAVPTEVRLDPLTGAPTRVGHFSLPPRAAPAGLPDAVEDSGPCPFCPPLVEQVTPRFPRRFDPSGRLRRGEAVLFPNLSPYDRHSAVVVAGARHLVPPTELDPDAVGDALAVLAEYFRRLPARSRSGAVGWNYMPAAGASLAHPHLHAVAGRTQAWQAAERRGERRFLRATGTAFWPALVSGEEGGERWLGERDGWCMLVAFAPRGLLPDVLAVARDPGDLISVPEECLLSLARVVCRLSRVLASAGVAAWNLVLTPTADGDASTLRARMIPRFHPVERYASSDASWIQLGLGEAVTTEMPEAWAERLRPFLTEDDDDRQEPL